MNIEEVLNYNPSTDIPDGDQDDNDNDGVRQKRRKIDLHQQQSSSSFHPGTSSSNDFSQKDFEKLIERTEHVNEIDEATLKRLILQLERKIQKNQEMRIKYADSPPKFMDSEIELFDTIKEMHVVATQPALFNILIELSIIPPLLGLLSHENTDIACAVVALIQELTDLDDVDEIDEVGQLMNALLDNQITVLLVNNMERLDENVKEESEGIYNSLAIIENLTDYKPELSKDVKPLIQWLLRKLKSKPIFYSNKLYASEILSILLQNSDDNRTILGSLNGIDILLHVVSYYKRHDPSTIDEEEFIENLFNCLCSAIFQSSKNRELFYHAEGIELMVLILKEKRSKKSNSDVRVCVLKLLSHLFSSVQKPDQLLSMTCDKFVEILGLRVLMPIYLKPITIIGQKRKRKIQLIDQVEEHSLSIILALLRYCRLETKQRVLNKFRENNCVKTERLVELHLKYLERLQRFDEEMMLNREKNEQNSPSEQQERMFLDRLNEGGLFTLQLIDQIIVLLISAEQETANTNQAQNSSIIKDCIIKLLKMHKHTSLPAASNNNNNKKQADVDPLQMVKKIVREYALENAANNLHEDNEDENNDMNDQDTEKLLKLLETI